MNLGAEPKKIAVLAGLVLFGGYEFYANVLSDSSPAPPQTQAAKPEPLSIARNTEPVVKGPVRRASRTRQSDEFRPSLKMKPEDAPDLATIDPTLRLDLLAKVQGVELAGGARNLFQFSTAPPPPIPKDVPTVIPKTPAQIAQEQAQKKNEPSTPPPPPPITLKYFGYSAAKTGGLKRAFFLDGEDILVAAEGEMVKKRYKVVRIGVNSVVMEDTETKSQQSLPLQEEAAG